MEKPMKTPKIPHTDSIEELARFWDSHDLTDFEDALEEVTEPIFERQADVNPDHGDLYGGLSGVTFEVDRFQLDAGVTISRTFAHLLMRPSILTFSPAPHGQLHPGPWREAKGSFGFDLAAEIFVPKAFGWPRWFDRANTIRWVAALLRLKATPRLAVPVLSNVSFSEVASADQEVRFWPVESESERTRMLLNPNAAHQVTSEQLEWVRLHWINAGHLTQEHAEFDLAMGAFDNCSFGRNPELAMLQLWGALEALFSPGRDELRFRISANVATFLEPPGAERHSLQQRVAKLYDSRSAAAHGRAKNVEDALIETYSVTRRVLLTIIEQNHVPSLKELESKLFGSGVSR